MLWYTEIMCVMYMRFHHFLIVTYYCLLPGHDKNKLFFDNVMMSPLQQTNTLSQIFIVLPCWHKHSTDSSDACLTEMQQILFLSPWFYPIGARTHDFRTRVKHATHLATAWIFNQRYTCHEKNQVKRQSAIMLLLVISYLVDKSLVK